MTGPPDESAARKSLIRQQELLLVELASTQAAVAEIRRLRADRSDDDEHDPEGTPLSAEWARLDGLHRATRQRIADVAAALVNLDAGHYGVCESCGKPIAAGRLAALPTARRCVSCASRADQALGPAAGPRTGTSLSPPTSIPGPSQ